MITMTTIGYGDISPETEGGKIFSVIFLLFGVISVAKLAKDLLEYSRSFQQSRMLDFVVNSYKTEDELSGMDMDHDGRIDKVEWLTHLLCRTESVQRGTIDGILHRFEELDVDGDGFVTYKDVQMFREVRDSLHIDAANLLHHAMETHDKEVEADLASPSMLPQPSGTLRFSNTDSSSQKHSGQRKASLIDSDDQTSAGNSS
eukprot:gb/GEZN01019455.1/.p1 GENE.gb/GEZN01019455.1/~~gb/GEZN01019455.1/.p1  ORF type:complete len:221 (-),score=25.05 gb/GEZN01019455.1/:56-661(-)